MSGRIFVGVDGGCKEHVCTALDEAKQVIWQERVGNDHAGCDKVLEKIEGDGHVADSEAEIPQARHRQRF